MLTLVLLVYGGLLYLTYFGFTHVPGGFIPEQDKGYLIVNAQLPDGRPKNRMGFVLLDELVDFFHPAHD